MRFKRAAAGLIASVMALTALVSPFTSAAAEGIFPEPVTGETENNNVVTATADDSGLVYGDNGTLTKAEWLHDLVTVFDMKVEEGDPPDNYFTDVAYDSEYYDDIMLATEFGVVNVEAGGELGPDDTVDREYASVTLNFCLGFQLDDDTYTFSESSDEAYADELTAFQVALNRNWFALSGGAFLPSKAVTSAEAKDMLSDAQQVLADAQIDDTKEGTFEFADYVIDFTPYQVVEFNEDNTVTIYAPDKKLAVGDTFVVYDQELPFVYTATAIKTDGSDIIVTTTDAPDDAIVNYVAEGTIKADIATFNPADNVDVTYVKDDATALTMSKARGVTVTKDSIMVDMKIPISSGIDVSVSCDLKNIALHHKENVRDGYYYASVTGETTLTTSLNIDPLKGSGVSGKYYLGYISTGAFSASLYAELSLSGKLMTVYTGNFEIGVSYQRFKGFRVIKSFTKKSFNFCADISAKVAMTAECKIDIVVLEAKANVSIGIQAKYNKKVYGDDKLPGICEDIQAYLYAGGSISATIIKVATFSRPFDFIDKNNSPYRLYLHYDDGNQVDVCGRDISDPSSPTPVRRYTSPSSTGFGSRWSSSQSSKWHSGSNGSSAQQPEKLWEYSLDDDKNATITAYNGYSSSLVIPTKIDGYTVTAIGDSAFANNTRLVMVVIPDSVTKVESFAFSNCTNLSKISLSKKLTDLCHHAFENCAKLTEITIPKSLESCSGGFEGPFYHSGLNKVNFEKGITKIPQYLFSDATALETIAIPDTVTLIGVEAFSDCSALKNVTIPDSVTKVESFAFSNCTNLSKISLSKNLTDLCHHAFENCVKLTEITIPKSLESCSGGFEGPFYHSGLNKVNFEEGITKIPQYLFSDATALETIAIPDTVTLIGVEAFSDCSALKNVTIPDSVTEIGSQAFYECSSLETITIPNSVTKVESFAFSNCTNLSKISLSKNLTDLCHHAFENCVKLTEITIPKSLESCSGGFEGPFYHSGLNKVNFEEGITKIPQYLFSDATALETIAIPDTVTLIGGEVFSDCSALKNVTIPDSVTEIGSQAFNKCTSLETITLPESIKTLGDYAFDGCTLLSAIKFPSLITEIGNGMCGDCTSLVTVKMGDKVASIGNNAFQNCTSLKNITLSPETEYIYSNAFSNCDLLESIVIPDKVTAIYDNAFSDCDKLSSVTLSKTLRSIDSNAFNNCDSLTAIKIPDSVETIGERAFYGCEKLADVNMGNGVSKLYSEAFRLCPALTKIVLSNNLTSIPEYAFADCTKLTDVTIYPGVTEIATNAFSYPAKTTMRGLKGSYAETYANDRGMTFEAITSVDASMLTVKFKNDYDEYENAPSFTYTGKPFKPDVKVYLGSYELTAGTDYKIVSYKNNTKIGTATCTIQGLGTYTGTTTGSFTIAPISLPGYSWYYSLEYSDYDYTGKEIKPAVTCEGLTEGTDFTVRYKDNINAGTAQVIITGIGNYSGTYTLEFTINPVTICTDVSQLQSKHPYDENVHEVYVYNGAENAKNLYLTFSEDTQFEEYSDYLYIYDANGEEVGSYTGDELSGKTITVPGSYVKLVLNTDSSNNEYGFRVVSVTDSIECTIHTFGDWVITEDATCTEKGSKIRVCSVCEYEEVEEIPALGHDIADDDWFVDYNATCVDDGRMAAYCARCGEFVYKTIPATGNHDFSDWKTTKPATCTATGTKTRTCSVCGKVETQTIAKTAHKYVNTVVKPTYTAQGYTLHKCSVCGASYKDNYTAKLTIANMGGFKAKSKSYNSITLQWNKNTSATGYELQKWNGKKWVALAKITKNITTTYTVKSLKASTTYKYRIRAYKTIGKATQYSGYKELSVNTNPSNMSGFKAKSKSYNSITLQWNKNTSATGYELQKWNGKKWVALTKIAKNSTTTYTVKSLKASSTNKYRIRAYKTIGKATQYSGYKELSVNTNPSNMSGFKAKSKSYNSITLQWNKNTSATGYELQKWNGKKWVALTKITKNSTTTYTVKSLKASSTYKYRIRAYKTIGKATQYSAYSATLSVRTNPSNMGGFKAKSKSYNSITLQWNKNTSATGYELQKWNGKKWVALTKITRNSTTTYTVKRLKASTTYKYRIRAYKTIGKATQYSAYSATLSVRTNPSNMSGFKAKRTAKTSVTLQWRKNTSATGYEIQKWNGKKWVSAAKVTKNSTVTSTVKNLKKNTSYRFRIRAYKTIGKATQYSSWSGTLTVRTKK